MPLGPGGGGPPPGSRSGSRSGSHPGSAPQRAPGPASAGRACASGLRLGPRRYLRGGLARACALGCWCLCSARSAPTGSVGRVGVRASPGPGAQTWVRGPCRVSPRRRALECLFLNGCGADGRGPCPNARTRGLTFPRAAGCGLRAQPFWKLGLGSLPAKGGGFHRSQLCPLLSALAASRIAS